MCRPGSESSNWRIQMKHFYSDQPLIQIICVQVKKANVFSREKTMLIPAGQFVDTSCTPDPSMASETHSKSGARITHDATDPLAVSSQMLM